MKNTVPANLVVSLMADILYEKMERLRNKMKRHPETVKGRQQEVNRLRQQVRLLRTTMRGKGGISAEIAGLLLTWAGGNQESLAILEDFSPLISQVRAEDYVTACKLILCKEEENKR